MPELLASLNQEVSELKWRNSCLVKESFEGARLVKKGRNAVRSPLESAPVDWFLDVSYFNSEHLPRSKDGKKMVSFKNSLFLLLFYFVLRWGLLAA